MSIRISLIDPPEFYTNLDVINGRVVLALSRPEQVGAIVVKLEGESRTALAVPSGSMDDENNGSRQTTPGGYPAGGNIVHENHKILYKVAQVFPDKGAAAAANGAPIMLPPGQHEFAFRFKVPFNNACSDPAAMARIGGLAGAGGFTNGPGLFGLGGIRVMDGSRQLMYQHVTKTLPPSFTGFPREAEIRYFIKVTIQRPGLFRENWRYQVGFKFLPIEPPRPPKTLQEAYARRPFAFRPRSPPLPDAKKRTSFFGGRTLQKGNPSSSSSSTDVGAGAGGAAAATGVGAQKSLSSPSPSPAAVDPKAPPQSGLAPSIEMTAFLPHPSILTCNQPIPLRLVAKKLAPSRELVYLTSLEIHLVGNTIVRCQDLVNTETTRWVVVSRTGLSIPLCDPDSPAGADATLPRDLWDSTPLPNTVMPSFVTCNLSRDYRLELRLGLSWGLPPLGASSSFFGTKYKGKGKGSAAAALPAHAVPQAIVLPLQFNNVEVFSGMAPPAPLVEAMNRQRRATGAGRRPNNNTQQQPVHASGGGSGGGSSSQTRPPPPLPVRRPTQPQPGPPAAHDPLYPPQLAPGQVAPAYDDAPPSYDEAMAEAIPPAFTTGQPRPAYSGVTNENAPLTIPEKG